MPIAIKTHVKPKTAAVPEPETSGTVTRATATLEKIPGQGLIARIIVPIDLNKLRYKGGKSAYYTYNIWIDGQKGCRAQGNVFISVKRLTKDTLDKATWNYETKSHAPDIDDEADEEELF